ATHVSIGTFRSARSPMPSTVAANPVRPSSRRGRNFDVSATAGLQSRGWAPATLHSGPSSADRRTQSVVAKIEDRPRMNTENTDQTLKNQDQWDVLSFSDPWFLCSSVATLLKTETWQLLAVVKFFSGNSTAARRMREPQRRRGITAYRWRPQDMLSRI